MTRCYGDVFLVALLSVVFGATVAAVNLTDFQTIKLSRMFYILDANGDGWLKKEDYHIIFGNILCEPGFAKYTRTEMHRKKVPAVWANFPGLDVTKDDFLALASNAIGTKEFNASVNAFATAMHDVWDFLEPFGVWTLNEFRYEYDSVGIDVSLAEFAFKKMDANNDSQISLQEYMDAVALLVLSNDRDDAGAWAAGSLEPR